MSDADGDSTMVSDHSSVDEGFDNGDSELASRAAVPNASNLSAPRTPSRFAAVAELSPPNSQGVPTTSASAFAFASSSSGAPPAARLGGADGGFPDSPPGSTAGLNANGKRVHSSAMGAGAEVLVPAAGGNTNNSGAASAGQPIGKASSGYEWARVEDEPGFGWKNKKAVEEFHRAMDQIVGREHMVKSRYGDPCLQGR